MTKPKGNSGERISSARGVKLPRFETMAKSHDWPTTLRIYTLSAIMTQRGISMANISEELGISKPRVGQLFIEAWGREESYDRISEAITAITEQRGGVYRSIQGTDDIHAAAMEAGFREWIGGET